MMHRLSRDSWHGQRIGDALAPADLPLRFSSMGI
jgi:hypothetical protein